MSVPLNLIFQVMIFTCTRGGRIIYTVNCSLLTCTPRNRQCWCSRSAARSSWWSPDGVLESSTHYRSVWSARSARPIVRSTIQAHTDTSYGTTVTCTNLYQLLRPTPKTLLYWLPIGVDLKRKTKRKQRYHRGTSNKILSNNPLLFSDVCSMEKSTRFNRTPMTRSSNDPHLAIFFLNYL